MTAPMVPIPVPAGVAPWVSWIFVAVAIGAFVVVLIGGIQRYRRMNDEPGHRDVPDDKGDDR